MADLKIAVLGLDRLGVSIALRLRSYMAKGGPHRFVMVGHDSRSDHEKAARKQKLFKSIERGAHSAVADADIVLMNLPYEDVESAYDIIASHLRDGVVILDTAATKLPSLAWAGRCLGGEHHVIGFSVVVGGATMLDHEPGAEVASEDYLLDSAIVLTPSVSSMKEAIDLAVNFALILGGKPQFLDPSEHDSLTAVTELLPQALGVAAYRAAMGHNAWQDAQRLTNPAFNLLTRFLLTRHPDAMRDEWLANRDALSRGIEDLRVELAQLQRALMAGDEAAVEAFLIEASDEYQDWINRRHKGEWGDEPNQQPRFDTSIASTLFGGAIAGRLFGKNQNDNS